jgi:hypothetical protein
VNKKTKSIIAGISIIITAISGCVYNLTSGSKDMPSAISESVEQIQIGVSEIQKAKTITESE